MIILENQQSKPQSNPSSLPTVRFATERSRILPPPYSVTQYNAITSGSLIVGHGHGRDPHYPLSHHHRRHGHHTGGRRHRKGYLERFRRASKLLSFIILVCVVNTWVVLIWVKKEVLKGRAGGNQPGAQQIPVIWLPEVELSRCAKPAMWNTSLLSSVESNPETKLKYTSRTSITSNSDSLHLVYQGKNTSGQVAVSADDSISHNTSVEIMLQHENRNPPDGIRVCVGQNDDGQEVILVMGGDDKVWEQLRWNITIVLPPFIPSLRQRSLDLEMPNFSVETNGVLPLSAFSVKTTNNALSADYIHTNDAVLEKSSSEVDDLHLPPTSL